jgi:Xaa-Pro aminopeptidase
MPSPRTTAVPEPVAVPSTSRVTPESQKLSSVNEKSSTKLLEARRIKTPDEIALLTQACSMVDAAYEELYEFLRPGVRENECVGVVSKVLYDVGSE